MKQIPLTKGQFAIVDDCHFKWLIYWKWTASWHEDTKSYYAYRKSRKCEGLPRHQVLLHRQILGLKFGDGKLADHKNRNTLDCRIENLRVSSRGQNQWNSKIRKSKSGFKGVYRQGNRWVAQIGILGNRVYLGIFKTPREAHAVFCAAAARLCGKFARTA